MLSRPALGEDLHVRAVELFHGNRVWVIEHPFQPRIPALDHEVGLPAS